MLRTRLAQAAAVASLAIAAVTPVLGGQFTATADGTRITATTGWQIGPTAHSTTGWQ
ncbi:hypothetical protein [Streptomyces sp. G-G2]|uniref:hypothetical protein n=1 Tax=Streptomyces sp. G-G2 TaxID=3046201 RepID=UPI0024B970AB|nr:hypothetical protein [Streptomyces sp. G-G2]MDJ0380422.1 hypothetical protein [Streptomyces sp. G-G2]